MNLRSVLIAVLVVCGADRIAYTQQIGMTGVPSENGPDGTLRLTQRPEFAFTEFHGVAPLIVAGEIDVLPAKRGKMLSEHRVWGMPVFA